MDVNYSILINIDVLIGISDERGLLKIISNWGLFDSVTNSEQSIFWKGCRLRTIEIPQRVFSTFLLVCLLGSTVWSTVWRRLFADIDDLKKHRVTRYVFSKSSDVDFCGAIADGSKPVFAMIINPQ